MELIKVEITATVTTAAYGTLSAGDTLRTNAEFAKHLVEDCGAARYAKVVEDQTSVAPQKSRPARAERVVKN